MKLVIASDIHGSAYYCRKLLKRLDEAKEDRLILLGDVERGLAIPQKGTLEQLAQQVFRDE